jgi:hypothetical protein
MDEHIPIRSIDSLKSDYNDYEKPKKINFIEPKESPQGYEKSPDFPKQEVKEKIVVVEKKSWLPWLVCVLVVCGLWTKFSNSLRETKKNARESIIFSVEEQKAIINEIWESRLVEKGVGKWIYINGERIFTWDDESHINTDADINIDEVIKRMSQSLTEIEQRLDSIDSIDSIDSADSAEESFDE